MKHFALILLAYVGFVLDLGARSELSLNGVSPEFLLLALSVAATCQRDNSAIIWAAVMGFLVDCISSGPLGVTMFCSIVAVFAMRKMLPRRKAYYPPVSVGICAVLAFAVLVSSSAARCLIVGQAVDWRSLLTLAAGGAGYTAVLFTGLRVTYGGVSGVLLRFVGADPIQRGAMGGRYS
ncbi:MAG: rod shape-determining protein MreD [Planctomycetaceae bacterium]|jgi:rod shape-determining protein MreD|nr:rod shape-determining protein MreD [Planctomycetaceae bacterium]MBT6156624.1 rod shape-determining protein MreD [Planctomycetaceae bacterium]MBT6483991.1 rod shape-determining protein MreD [Planctomycetaceae bacterium]MBT6497915.1 rod shape-determining protein MreD [Planctomycetaceae bacterium]